MPKVSISVANEGFDLEGVIDGQEAEGGGLVVCHPSPKFGGTMEDPVVVELAKAFAAAGQCVLRFNFRGVGRSAGRSTNGFTEHRDVISAVRWMRQRLGPNKVVSLVGYSFGSLMGLRAIAHLKKEEQVACFVGIGFPVIALSDQEEDVSTTATALQSVPTKLISGNRDNFSNLAELSKLLPNAFPNDTVTLTTIKNANHFPSGLELGTFINETLSFVLPFQKPSRI